MSTSLDDLTAFKPEIKTVREQDIISINTPYRHYIQESQLLSRRFTGNKTDLEAGGMDFKIVEKIIPLAGACRELHSQVANITLPSTSALNQWRAATEEADELQYDLKEAMYYAFRNFPELLAKVSYLRTGGSNEDLIQDLNDFAVLGRANSELLTAVGYDLAHVERAAELAKEMADLYAQVTLDRNISPERTVLRNKAFTLLKKVIDELNMQARFILRANKEKAAEFIINPPRKKPSKKVAAEPEKTIA